MPKRRPTGLLVALFSALTLLISMAIISFINNQPDSTTASTGYKSEDQKVPIVDETPPPVAVPKNNAETKTLTGSNPLYSTSLEPPMRYSLELLPSDKQKDEELEANLRAYLDCLTRIWGPTPEKAGYKAFQPRITVFPEGKAVATECRKQKSQSTFYCMVDQRIYITQDMLGIPSTGLSKTRAISNLIITHEYKHTIQGQSGTLVNGNALVKSDSDSRAVEISRCLETQTDCFAETAMSSLW